MDADLKPLNALEQFRCESSCLGGKLRTNALHLSPESGHLFRVNTVRIRGGSRRVNAGPAGADCCRLAAYSAPPQHNVYVSLYCLDGWKGKKLSASRIRVDRTAGKRRQRGGEHAPAD
ncbi:MAG: hypothetical protein NT115_00770 [Proteobacteria bacterium]|nr:hypothetical protein [Pseudomonadota bacterium]